MGDVKYPQLPWLSFSFCGAYLVTHIPPTHLRKALPFVLVAVAIYTFKKKGFWFRR